MMGHAVVVMGLFLRGHLRHPGRCAIFVLGLCAPCLLLLGGITLFNALRQHSGQSPADEFVVLQAGAGAESRSLLSTVTANAVATELQAGARIGRGAMSSQIALDVMIAAAAPGLEDDDQARTSGTLRGQDLESPAERARMVLMSGRWPRPGAREIVVSPAVARWARERAATGAGPSELALGRQHWRVVGVARDTAGEQAWVVHAPIASLQSAFGLDGTVSMLVLHLDPDPRSGAVEAARRAIGRLRGDALELVQRRVQLERATGELERGLAWPWRCALGLVAICALLAQAMLTAVILIERQPAQDCLHALGVTRRAIHLAALIEGAVVGSIGAALAIVAGTVALARHPMKVALANADFDLALRPDSLAISLTLACGALLGAATFGLRRATPGCLQRP